MSAPHERPALDPAAAAPRAVPPPALYDHAERLRAAGPLPPPGGHPLPATARPPDAPRRPGLRHREARAAVTGVLLDHLTASGAAPTAVAATERALLATGVRERSALSLAAALAPPDPGKARVLARALVRTGTTAVGVAAGLGLLTRLAEPEDVPYLRALGLLDGLGHAAASVLDPLDRPAAALTWLIHRVRGEELRAFTEAVAADDRPAVLDRLTRLPTGARDCGPETARRVAEAAGLAGTLRSRPDRPALLTQALLLLTRMTSRREYRAEILRYGEAVEVYGTLAAHAHRLPRDLDHRARLLTLALDLHSGASHLLAWPPGHREALLAAFLDAAEAVGDVPVEPGERRRADWADRTARHLRAVRPGGPGPAPRLRIEVAVADPAEPDVAETRFLIDGRPLVAEFFGRGPGDAPERLLDSGALRATAAPRKVRLAEAYCTEGCCGALYVTVRREGGHVVWSDWRRPGRGPAGPQDPPAYRFDAGACDAEVARAENDHDWTWPARRTARLIAAGLRDRPGLLTRWGLEPGWTGTDFSAPDTTLVTFTGPPLTAPPAAPGGPESRQFLWRLPDDGTPPEERAAGALRGLAGTDPRTLADS
ncbi:hypothetical protein GCM10022244_36710 [Streptomyces gulbargensis]|uniref:Uncharacterized protein n=1 Tax=Streptomyces gulbargensis TaxID=364901 RepID=A0ABP7MJK3_9ACTN